MMGRSHQHARHEVATEGSMDIDVLMSLTFRRPQSEWDAAKNEALERLKQEARRNHTITYGDLTNAIRDILPFEPDDPAFHAMLGQISVAEDRAGRGMLSALVVNKSGERRGQPGRGFFELAQQLGRDTRDENRLWIDEVRIVTDYWRHR
jgi:hypothetical protein